LSSPDAFGFGGPHGTTPGRVTMFFWQRSIDRAAWSFNGKKLGVQHAYNMTMGTTEGNMTGGERLNPIIFPINFSRQYPGTATKQ
jgi:hypothetical protein